MDISNYSSTTDTAASVRVVVLKKIAFYVMSCYFWNYDSSFMLTEIAVNSNQNV